MAYYTGFLIPVKDENKERYVKSAEASWPLFKEYGAIEQIETWGDNIQPGKVTGFDLAVKLEPGEAVVFSWLKWPDRETADGAWQKMMEDPRMAEMDTPFDLQRMMWGGFAPVFES